MNDVHCTLESSLRVVFLCLKIVLNHYCTINLHPYGLGTFTSICVYALVIFLTKTGANKSTSLITSNFLLTMTMTMKYYKRTQQLSCDIFVEQKWWSIIEFTQLAIIVQIFQYNHQSIIMNKWLYKNLHYILTCPWKESLKFYL